MVEEVVVQLEDMPLYFLLELLDGLVLVVVLLLLHPNL